MIGIILGAPIGALLRFWMSKWNGHFPIATLLINLIGAFLIGIVSVHFKEWYLFLAIGILGSFTTFSTMNVEIVKLYHSNRRYCYYYFGLSYMLGPILCWIGTMF